MANTVNFAVWCGTQACLFEENIQNYQNSLTLGRQRRTAEILSVVISLTVTTKWLQGGPQKA